MTIINSAVQSAVTSNNHPASKRQRTSRLTGLGLALSCAVALGTSSAEAAAPVVARSLSAPISISEGVASRTGTTLSVTLPANVKAGSFAAKLNGKDVTLRFKLANGQNRTATLLASDGVRVGKNVLMATAQSAQGHAISARLRFETANPAPKGVLTSAAAVPASALVGSGPLNDTGVNTPFLPPTVSLQTNGAGGWVPGNTWFTLGDTNYPTLSPTSCSNAIYAVMVFDRQTLEEVTAAPEGAGAPRCFSNGADLTTYLQTIPKGQMVIAGTIYGNNLDSGLDATSIGGSKWKGGGAGGAGYLILGVAGADATTGYESYYLTGGNHTAVDPFAKGTLQEDANGNYNFVSSNVVEYFVVPNAPANEFHAGPVASSVVIGNGDGTFSSYTAPDGIDGYYLLEINRGSLASMPVCTPSQTIGNTTYFPGCGQFYPTGTSSHSAAVSMQAYQDLAKELGVIASDPWRMAFLTTVERASCCDEASAVRGPQMRNLYPYPDTGFLEFANALAPLGGTPSATTYARGTNQDGPPTFYTLVTAAGIGGPLNGSAVESSSLFSDQGQTGTLHGTLARNGNGLYMPAQASQESTDVLVAKGGTAAVDFKLGEWAAQQPVPWPALSQVVLSQGGYTADSISGQVGAYRYISSQLLANHYIKGISSDHLDDIHYFFTGSSNTFIDYHTFDPLDLSWPSACTGDTCTISVAGKDTSFTLNDFNAVRAQTSLEVQYLTNAMQFLVTGSTNMKAVVAGGNANVGLALTGAAATILGSSLKPAPTTPVHMSWMNIMSMIGSVASVATAIPGVGEVAGIAELSTQVIKDIGSVANAIGNASSLCGTFGGAFSPSSSNALPASYAKFATTIGELANGSLQGQMSAGFDVLSDSITSDWGRLSQIGPMVVDSNNAVFFAQNLAAQNVAVAALTKGAQRSFYMSLMPVFYQVHFWPKVEGYRESVQPMPSMGWQSGEKCDTFYLNPQSGNTVVNLAPTQANWHYSIGGGDQWDPTPFLQDEGDVDFWVIAGPTNKHGSFGASNVPIDSDLAATLFSPQGLNIPIEQFVSQYGPMAGSSTWIDASNGDTPQGASHGSVCDLREFADNVITSENPGVTNPDLTTTATTLTSPQTAILGEDVQLSAAVAAGSNAVSDGQVYFIVDNTTVATVQLANGSAAFDLKGLALGDHTVKAAYSRVAPYDTSESDATPLTVYANAPDLSLSASTKTLDVSYGADSEAVDLEVTSKYGITGPVDFSCSGLPVGMTCSFSPSSATLAAGGTAKTSLVVTTGTQEGAAILALLLMLGAGGGLLGACSSGVGLKNRSARLLLTAGALSVASLVGCGSNGGTQQNTNPNAFQEKGTKTILVTATVGNSSRSVPIQVTVK